MNKRLPLTKLGIEYFLHPIPAVAVFVLFINDHYLKQTFPGFITGKISDFAGVFFLPLYLCALVGLIVTYGIRSCSQPFRLTKSRLLLAIAFTDFIFISVKIWPTANSFYLTTMSHIGLPSRLVMDPWDLSALIMNMATYVFARRFILADGG